MRPAVAVLALAVVLAGCSALPAIGSEGDGGGAATTVTPVPVPEETATATPRPLPPGVARNGDVDGDRLALAHKRGLPDDVRVHERFRYTVLADGEVSSSFAQNVTFWYGGPDNYRVDQFERSVNESGGVTTENTSAFVGPGISVLRYELGNGSYRTQPYRTRRPPDPTRQGRIGLFLSVNATALSLVEEGPEPRYRIVGEGPANPERLLQNTFPDPLVSAEARLADHRVTVLVTESGVVRRLSLSYTLVAGESDDRRQYRVAYTLWYERVGNASVPEPAWVERWQENATG